MCADGLPDVQRALLEGAGLTVAEGGMRLLGDAVGTDQYQRKSVLKILRGELGQLPDFTPLRHCQTFLHPSHGAP